MSLVHRTAKWITIGQLAQDWAIELASDSEERPRVEQQLRHALCEDVANGRFDESGPLMEGSRLGLRVINSENRAGFAKGQDLLSFVRDIGPSNPTLHHIVIMKEAVLDFARRRELLGPSWWTDPIANPEETKGRTGKGVKPAGKTIAPQRGKRPRITTYLAEHYPRGVPDPGHLPRKQLKADLLKWDPTLTPLDDGTMKSAIDAHNANVKSAS